MVLGVIMHDGDEASKLADALYDALERHHFSTEHWEQRPLLLHDAALAGPLSALLPATELPMLSANLEAAEVTPQVMRDGERCEPRELCWDFLDGSSIIINKLDVHWPPVGRLCAALRSRFLHVFAVMYLTPRDSRAVPAHSDDQDVFIVQVGGRKAWSVYGSPIELPYSHEQLGKGAPIDSALLGPPLLSAELEPGSVLYLPRGFVHEARATTGGCSLHVTLTVQTSDLNWRTFVQDGLSELHRAMDISRLPLPLEPGAGGYDSSEAMADDARAPAPAVVPSDGVHDGVYSPDAADVSDADSQMKGRVMVRNGSTSTVATAPVAAELPSSVLELLNLTETEVDRGFELAMRTLTRKLAFLNGAQDTALATMTTQAHQHTKLPHLLRCPPGVSMAVRSMSAAATNHLSGHNRGPRATPPADAMSVHLTCTRADGSMTTTHTPHFAHALAFIGTAARKGMAFRVTDLPEVDEYEQVALCSRLLDLGALCPHDTNTR